MKKWQLDLETRRGKNIFYFVLLPIILNLVITCTIQRYGNPELTETQLGMLIPKNFIWRFEYPAPVDSSAGFRPYVGKPEQPGRPVMSVLPDPEAQVRAAKESMSDSTYKMKMDSLFKWMEIQGEYKAAELATVKYRAAYYESRDIRYIRLFDKAEANRVAAGKKLYKWQPMVDRWTK